LVPEAETMGGVGVIRSLGRAGYPVHACARTPRALGLRSRYCRTTTVCPEYHLPEFLDWLRLYLRYHKVRAIIPSEAFLIAIRPAYAELSALLPLPNQEDILYRGLSKADVYRVLTGAGGVAAGNLPRTMCLDESDPDPSESQLAGLGTPVFLKVDGCHSRNGEPGRVIKAQTVEEASDGLARLRRRYGKVLVQGFVSGRGVGAFFLIWNGEILAEFQHRRIHEVPHTGGVSSYRESYRHAGIRDDALEKISCLAWRGVGMLEYRLDEATGRLYFIEFNGRFWGSLHLALYAGVDFPALLLDAFHGHPQPPPTYEQRVRCRNTFPEEVQYVWSRLADSELRLGARAWSVLEFVLLSLDPRIYNDLLFPGDRGLWLTATKRSIAALLAGVARRLMRRRISDA
jgi:predicted ATP-grasp superfamily ATP-dependent carboligase